MGSEGDLRQDLAFFGRSEELYELVKHLRLGRHSLVTGDKGVGKSRLLLEARWVLSGRSKRIDFSPRFIPKVYGNLPLKLKPGEFKIMTIERCHPLGDFLREVCQKLFLNGDLPVESDEERQDWATMRKRLRSFPSAKVQATVFEALARSDRPYLVFLDTLDHISPSHQTFIETLLNIAVVASATVRIKENSCFTRIWASFVKIELGPLPRDEASGLINYFFQKYPIRVIDPELYASEILKSSAGNPFHMKNMLWHGSRQKFVDGREIRKLRQMDEGAYFNMGPIYIFGVALFTMLKIFSIGSSNRELYIYFSALGFIAYLVFRVFRTFFLFRPQKFR